MTLDHKRIGVMYLVATLASFLLGGVLAMVIRLQLLSPGGRLVGADTYNKLFTLHGAAMIFLFIIPAIPAALGNSLVPLLLGTRDVAFPRLNLASFYLWVVGALFTLGSLLGGAQVLATPVLGITLVLLAVERLLGVGIFAAARGGDPVLFQHFFWFYSHPAVYIMILPGMGIISEVIPVHAQRRIFGYQAIAYSSVAIAAVSFRVWGHHMFVAGQSELASMVFSALTFAVAVPSAIKVFNWTATLYRGSIQLTAPMLYALAFLALFAIGGLTGLFLATLAVDVHLHDTYFVVAHFHYVMMGGTVIAFLAGLHHWWPKMFGRTCSERWARAAWALIFAGFNITFLAQFVLGSRGMPRRYWHYLPKYPLLHQISTAGSWLLGLGFLLIAGYLTASLARGARAAAEPWGGRTLEWAAASPPSPHNFEHLPAAGDPCGYDPRPAPGPRTATAAAGPEAA